MSDLDRLTLHQLKTLLVFLETASVTAAARRLGITQPAASHALRGLREILGDPLLVGGARGMVLTPRALALAGPLRRTLGELTRVLHSEATFDASSARRRFVIATWDGLSATLVPRLLEVCRREAPGLDLDVLPLPQEGSAGVLEDGRVDLAMEVRPPNVPGLRQRVVATDDFVCVVRADHPAIDPNAPLDLDTWLSIPHALISPQGEGRSVVDDALAAIGRERRVQLRIRYFLAAPLIVARSDLALTAPRSIAEAMAALLPLRLLEPPISLPGFPVHAVWHEREDHDPGHRWLRERIAAIARPQP